MKAENPVDPVERIKSVPLLRYALLITAAWTVCLTGSLAWNIYVENRQVFDIARNEARAQFDKDQAFRRWAAARGGVYVVADEKTPPNPCLVGIPERDITTPSGKPLTLVNPAYMVRLVMEEYAIQYGFRSHLTSLKPLRPENTPDEWERRALESFEAGAVEASELAEIDGVPYLRVMRPVMALEGCLKCHGAQGYKEGDVRGGLAVAVPIRPIKAMHKGHINIMYLSHILIWVLGMLGITFGTRRIDNAFKIRLSAEESILRAKQEWEKTFDSIDDPIMILDTEHRIVRANLAMAAKLGMDVNEVEGLTCYRHVHDTDDPIADCPHAKLLEDGRAHTAEVYEDRMGGYFLVSVSPLHDEQGQVIGSVHLARDITESKRAEEQIRASLAEKEALLKEVHHRVKNNMQIISSLSNLQSRYLKSEEALRALKENRSRIRSMALVHEKLYRSESLAEVEASSYLRELVDDLVYSYGIDRERIACNVIADETVLDIDTLLPCGLIVNELVTNALKHAFPGDRSGEITVRFLKEEPNKVILSVSDNGIGLPGDVDPETSESLGLRLVGILAAQLEGTVEIERGEGTTFNITLYEEQG